MGFKNLVKNKVKTDMKIINKLFKLFQSKNVIEILNNVCVNKGTLHFTNLDCSVVISNSEINKDDGVYKIINNDFIRMFDVDDFPNHSEINDNFNSV